MRVTYGHKACVTHDSKACATHDHKECVTPHSNLCVTLFLGAVWHRLRGSISLVS